MLENDDSIYIDWKVLGKGIRKNGHKVSFSATAKSILSLINMKSIFFLQKLLSKNKYWI